MPLIIPANSITGGFEVANSLRFNSGSNDSLTITPSSASNRKTWTFSCWYKGSGTQWSPFSGGGGSSDLRIIIDADGRIRTNINGVGNYNYSNGLFRDVSAWYHLVWKFDTTESTASDRSILYINGTAISDQNSSNFSLNTDYAINTNTLHTISRLSNSDIYHHDGYMSEVCFIDGQALEPTSFGEFDADSGIWKPINVSGLTFGTNGFYLDFENSGSLGADVSGNGNNFTVNNLTSIDQTTDTPTNNYATFNFLQSALNGNTTIQTFSEGNLQVVTPNTVYSKFGGASTIGASQGKWYAEIKISSAGGTYPTYSNVGITGDPSYNANTVSAYIGGQSFSAGYYNQGGLIQVNNVTELNIGVTKTPSYDVMVAMDLDNNKVYFGIDGTWVNSSNPSTSTGGFTIPASSTVPTGNYFFACYSASSQMTATYQANFGNPPFTISSGNSDGNGMGNFEYAVPDGYFALCTSNLAEYG